MSARYREDGKVSWALKGCGGINSTQEDMYRWHEALKTNRVISQSLLERQTTPYIESSSGSFHYAYGWAVRDSERKTKRIDHNGSNGIFYHSYIWLPEEDAVIIYATNASSPQVGRVANTVEEMIFDSTFRAAPIQRNGYFAVLDFTERHAPEESARLLSLINTEYRIDLDEGATLNQMGYGILEAEGNPEWAVELFKMNVGFFENDGNLWDSLGDGYFANGQREEAVESYKRALELDNHATAEKLDALLQDRHEE